MIKSVRNQKPETFSYPFLGVSDLGVVVLFSSEGEGTVISSASQAQSYMMLGYQSKTFLMSHFTPFNGSITLSNEVE